MELKSLHFEIPKHNPFDRGDWFQQVIGHFVKPILDTKLISSFWFSQYNRIRGNEIVNEIRFRFKTDSYEKLIHKIDFYLDTLKLIDLKDEEEYDGNEFRSRRFVGENQRNISPEKREELIWNFLHAASLIYLDTFSHKDSDGYWVREENLDRANNIDGETLESIHHLFCNLSNFSVRVDLLETTDPQGRSLRHLIAGHYRRWNGFPDTDLRGTQLVHF